MTVTRAITATAMLAGLAIGAAGTAWAETTMSGHYIETETNPSNGYTRTNDWYFTPCGDGCASVTTAPGGQAWGQAQLVNGQWTMDGTRSAGCPDGTEVADANTTHFTWDANSLAGTAQLTNKIAACGFPVGFSFTNNMQLRQAP